ncbi:MAG: MFS transporter [Bacteroidales bacterium]|nr:MFS transporter [Bacteroidales bacterium]
MKRESWVPCIALATSTFIFHTSEFVPVALLTDIAAAFGATEAQVGMIISVYAWVVGLMSLPLMVAVAKMDWRKIMLWVLGLFSLFQLASALAPTYGALICARVGVACCHAVFWGIVPPYAVATAPQGGSAKALSFIITGSSIGTILGLPLGRMVGLWLSWRATFAAVAAVSALVTIACFIYLPKHRSSEQFSLRDVPHMLTNPMVMRIYVFILAIVTSYFMIYSYIEPFLAQVAQMSAMMITLTLSLMGAAGIVAGWAFARWFAGWPRWFFTGAPIAIAIYGLAINALAPWAIAVMVICFIGSMGCTCFNLGCQDMLIKRGPQPSTIPVATYSGIFNIGIGSGALLGGLVATHLGLGWIGVLAFLPAILGVLLSLPLTRYARA